MTNDLFDDGERGMDLIAINMQRGRDHGLPGYIFYREACGAGPIGSFDDFSNNMTPEVFFWTATNFEIEYNTFVSLGEKWHFGKQGKQ